ncbi:NUDIX domain-containing protein [Paenibacillus dakarensis]|uniref:NUDIX domain-containing protein n=1 Tax=Paenibacillus dakarensis TaxID=1527293 RepID=UPI0006D5AD37|nr:NUDIX domain-containing protein [Paenibacillus dakarensis]
MNRVRAFSAILKNGKIVMVKVDEIEKSFWTLPGGGVEIGETREQAAIREAMEEVNLEIKVVRFLFAQEYAAGIEYCYLAVPVDFNKSDIKLGYDPELKEHEQVLKQAEWIEINNVKDDLHVSKVIESLNDNEKMLFNIKIR